MLLHFKEALKLINLMLPMRLFAKIFGVNEVLITWNKTYVNGVQEKQMGNMKAAGVL